MFLREALQKCSDLEDEVASLFAALEAVPGVATDKVRTWDRTSSQLRRRSRLLSALASLASALGDDGPFLVQVPVQLAGIRRALAAARKRTGEARDAAAAERSAAAVDAASLEELHAGLLEVVEPELKRLLRAIDVEARKSRRKAVGDRAREAERRRAACPAPAP